VGKLALFHHDPFHDDAFVDGMVKSCDRSYRSTRKFGGMFLVQLKEWKCRSEVYTALFPANFSGIMNYDDNYGLCVVNRTALNFFHS